MSRTRLFIAAAVVAVSIVAGGVVAYATQHHGGQRLTFNVRVTAASKMTPDQLQAHAGDTVTINLTSDQTGEVHLHLYDIPFDAQAGQTVSHTFTADKTGHCLIEWESTNTPLGYLDVSP